MTATDSKDLDSKVDLTNCDREPIHVIGHIQPFGALMAIDKERGTVLQVSDNIADFLNVSPSDVLGREFNDVFVAGVSDGIRDYLVRVDSGIRSVEEIYAGRLKSGKSALLFAHVVGDTLVVEFEEFDLSRTRIAAVSSTLRRLESASTVKEYCDLLSTEIRRLTGYDRVMVYRFAPDASGWVFAEAKLEKLQTFMDLHYPASDIPEQARKLYQSNRVRLVADVQYEPVVLIPDRPPSGELLDMSLAQTRGVSSMHTEYLANMGVRTSLSAALISDDGLWGLVACHHYENAYALPFRVRSDLEVLCAHASLRILSLERDEVKRRRGEIAERHLSISSNLTMAKPLAESLVEVGDQLATMLDCSGFCVALPDELHCFRETPPQAFLQSLRKWLNDSSSGIPMATDCLGREFSAAENETSAAGMLAVPLGAGTSTWLIWFREEKVRSVSWGGDPYKSTSPGPSGERITPRKSFEKWTETVKGYATPWADYEVSEANRLRMTFGETTYLERAGLRAANLGLEEFVHAVAHDLATPLVTIDGFLGLLEKETATDGKLQKYVAPARSSAKRLLKRLGELLEFVRSTATDNAMEEVHLGELVQRVLDDSASQLEGSTYRVNPLHSVWGNPAQLSRLVQNLIENAVKYAGDRPPDIGVSTEESNGWVYLRVVDRGVGIDPKYAQQVFDLFVRLDENVAGTGLGLAICKRIVSHHRGEITVESELGAGSTFTVKLPATAERFQSI